MTVSTTTNKITYSGNGATTVFPFSFSTPAVASDIQVIYVDPSGNSTTLASTVYTIVFNPATTLNPTPVGGSVTYNPGGIPIPTGSTLTILRQLPLQQNTSLTNQISLFQQTIELALDYVTMLVQQAFVSPIAQAIQVPISDPPPAVLPPVALRANLIMGFDASGNPIATNSIPTGGSISSAMAPVCNAATLAIARTNLGLGNVAVEGIGGGLQDDGTGLLTTNTAVVVVNINSFTQNITKAFQGQRLITSFFNTIAACPLSSTLYNGFNFFFTNQGNVTASITINGADSFQGMSTGQAFVLAPGTTVNCFTNGAGTWFINYVGKVPSVDDKANYTLSASVSSGALTVSLKDINGNAPSFASPLLMGLGTGGGAYTPIVVAGPLTITAPLGATLGTQNAIPARIWVGITSTGFLAFYNALAQSAAGVLSSVVSWNEGVISTVTSISAAATSAQTWYTGGSSGSFIVRILGYVEVTTPTAGNWAVAPSWVQLWSGSNRKPGDIVQEQSSPLAGAPTTTSATYVALSGELVPIVPQSAANIIRVEAAGSSGVGVAATSSVRLSRGNVANTNLIGSEAIQLAGAAAQAPFSLIGYDMPGVISTVNYFVQGKTSAGTLTVNTNAQMVAKEIFT